MTARVVSFRRRSRKCSRGDSGDGEWNRVREEAVGRRVDDGRRRMNGEVPREKVDGSIRIRVELDHVRHLEVEKMREK